MGFKNSTRTLLYKLFSRKYLSYRAFYAAKCKFTNMVLSCPIGRLFKVGIYNTDKELKILIYPIIIGKNFSTKDSRWQDRDATYEHPERSPRFKKIGEHKLSIILNYLEKTQISFDDQIMDIGCAGGYYLRQLESKGWTNLVGVEPSMASEFLKQQSKKIRVYNEYFGHGAHLKENPRFCYFDGSIDRIPYGNDLSVLKHINPEYILVCTSSFIENFQRDWHVEFSKLGYYCLSKTTYFLNEDGVFVDIFGIYKSDFTNIISYYLFSSVPE